MAFSSQFKFSIVQLSRLWQEVTYNLKFDEVDKATEHKQRLEQRQREEARDRKERGVAWETKVCIGRYWGN